jgi:hypothetical protein
MTMHRTKMLVAGMMLSGLALAPLTSAGQEVDYQPLSVGVDAGTLGLGASVSWRFSDHFGIRGGINFLKIESEAEDAADIDIEGEFDAELRLLGTPVGVDFFPWRDRSFRMTLGVLINKNRVKVSADPDLPGETTVYINDNPYDAFNEQGVNIEVDQQTLAPYFSIGGNFYFDQAKRWSLAGELGVAYTGSPEAAITVGNPVTTASPGFQADRAAEESELENKMEDYKFYPIIKLGVNFSF